MPLGGVYVGCVPLAPVPIDAIAAEAPGPAIPGFGAVPAAALAIA